MKIRVLTALLLAGLPAAFAPAAFAEASRSIAISHADLDLTSAAGRATLDRRIAIAVNEACGTASAADLAGQNRADACRATLTAQAETQREVILAQRGGTQLAAVRR